MVSATTAFHGGQSLPACTPGEIRAALTGPEIADFDREYWSALAEAAETLDFSGLLAMLERWQRVAWSVRDDVDAHHLMLEHANRIEAGGKVATEPWQQTKARLGL
jgi:hypothetical protein